MINFSAISRDSIAGRFLRGILKLIPKNAALPILQGKLRGKKWIIGSGVFGYWLGTYEPEKQKLFEKIVKKGDIVFDIGAQVGFYTLLASELVGPGGKVFAFEPLPRNIFFLKKHLEINKIKNVEIASAAVSENGGRAYFEEGLSSSVGHLTDKKTETEVAVISLDDWILGRKIPKPDVIKIDAEGAENDILKGALKILIEYQPQILLSAHSVELREKCTELLKSLGFNISIGAGKDAYEIYAKTK